MQKKVGNVVIDDTWYPGEDLYTDGEIEDRMLCLAQQYGDIDYSEVIAREKSWPILYHFSHIRENILSWLPIGKEDEVLEIGSGCGAVTGALAAKAAQVDCIELSMKRTMINASRHRNASNVRILVGNFQDIEPRLGKKYDWITLIGVFEYSEAYIQSEKPYQDMLRRISSHLKPGGKIIVAIENRLGLKYWAGCTEDHVGSYFEGLEGYPHTSGVKTFSRSELEQVISEAGSFTSKFYYPYPDYKMPMAIYSDDYLPKAGELNNVRYNFDRERIRLFDEARVADTILQNHLFPEFSNSFLVWIEREEEE